MFEFYRKLLEAKNGVSGKNLIDWYFEVRKSSIFPAILMLIFASPCLQIPHENHLRIVPAFGTVLTF